MLSVKGRRDFIVAGPLGCCRESRQYIDEYCVFTCVPVKLYLQNRQRADLAWSWRPRVPRLQA